jgi:hypothetical protein
MRLLNLASTRKRTSEGHKPAIEEGALRGKVHAALSTCKPRGPELAARQGRLWTPGAGACPRAIGAAPDTLEHRAHAQGTTTHCAPPGAAAPSRLPVRLHAWSPRHGEDDAIACLQACEGFRRHGQHDHLAFRRSHPHAL